jgi:hypothetical protein
MKRKGECRNRNADPYGMKRKRGIAGIELLIPTG